MSLEEKLEIFSRTEVSVGASTTGLTLEINAS
jgi:hypothetical protein